MFSFYSLLFHVGFVTEVSLLVLLSNLLLSLQALFRLASVHFFELEFSS
jgi:hypothetical protein